ncbi:MAG TPA: hypothetical protein VF585_05295 [Chthoniobacterales bacterium]
MKLPFLLFSLAALTLHTQAADKVEWEPAIYPENQLFPSMLISTATVQLPEETFSTWDENHLGDTQGSIGVSVGGLAKGAKVEVIVQENDFLQKSVFSGVVDKPAEGDADMLIHPKIRYRYDLLGKVQQAIPLDITIELKVDGVSQGEKTQTINLRPINDCLFGVEETDENDETISSDYMWLFAAYVNEDHPIVDQLLKSALKLDVVDSFSGTQSGDSDEVLKQIFAVWSVLQKRGIKYSDITTNSRQSETVFSQSVRFLDQSLNSTQANCVDGSVLFASVLRKIGLEPSLVLVPGHMFISIPIDEENSIGLETTMLGSAADDEADVSNFPESAIEVSEELEPAWNSFQAAVSTGTGALTESAEKFKDSEEEGYDPNYQMIDVGVARGIGILPIARPAKPATGELAEE